MCDEWKSTAKKWVSYLLSRKLWLTIQWKQSCSKGCCDQTCSDRSQPSSSDEHSTRLADQTAAEHKGHICSICTWPPKFTLSSCTTRSIKTSVTNCWTDFMHFFKHKHAQNIFLQPFSSEEPKRSITRTRERTIIGSISYRNRYWVYRIESATVVSADITCINAGSSTVDGSHYTRWSNGVQAPAHACVLFYGPWNGRWLEGREAEGDLSRRGWYQVTKTAQYWSRPPSRRTPSTSRKWYQSTVNHSNVSAN